MKNPDTMTNEELDRAWAEAIGWRLQPEWGADKEPAWVDAEGRWKCWPAHLPSPSTNWSHWGLVYEFMVEKGWRSRHYQSDDGNTKWIFYKQSGPKDYWHREGNAPDLRTASENAALKALRGEGKGE